MTIEFYCPECESRLSFADDQKGKRRRCQSCGKLLIVPEASNLVPETIEQEQPEQDEPVPGFFRSMLTDSWTVIFHRESIAGLVFLLAATALKFFAGHVDYSFTMGQFRMQLWVGNVVWIVCWAVILYYYAVIIHETAYNADTLPQAEPGAGFGFIWNVVSTLYRFFMALLVVLMPAIIALMLLGTKGRTIAAILGWAGMFLFPMAVLIVSVADDVTQLARLDYIIKPVIKATGPYLLAAGLLLLFCRLQLTAAQYSRLQGASGSVIYLHLGYNFALQFLAIIAMRSIGLFYRHYSCYMPW